MDPDNKRKARNHFIRRVKERLGIKLKEKQFKSGNYEVAFRTGRRIIYYFSIQNLHCRIVYDPDIDELITVLSPGRDRMEFLKQKKRKNI